MGFFNDADFDVFQVEGLQARMAVLIERIRPKLTQLGDVLAPELTRLTGVTMYPHVAKHARRSVHPPADTWVAWGSSKRGYKALPHFEVGLFAGELYVLFALIYESPNKITFATRALTQVKQVLSEVPPQYTWQVDHMQPGGIAQSTVDAEKFTEMLERLRQVKKAELTCGLHIPRAEAVRYDEESLLSMVQETFKTLMPLYNLAL
jgi:uncharacterized protein YktB (UPF0637 family)